MNGHEFWADEDGCLASGYGDDYRTVGEIYKPADMIQICDAVNSHADLLAACQAALDYDDTMGKISDGYTGLSDAIKNCIRAAIDQATR